MSDSKNLNDLKPEQSWLKAEKMLDRHFRKKRIFIWSLALFVAALVISTTMIVNRFSEDVVSQNKNIVPGQTTDKSPVLKQEGASAVVNNAYETKRSPEHAGNEMPVNRSGKEKAEKKFAGDKSVLATESHLQNNENSSHKRAANNHIEHSGNVKDVNHQAEDTQAKMSEGTVQSKSPGHSDDLNKSFIEDAKDANQQLIHSDPGVARMNPIYTMEVSFAMPDQYSVSDSRVESKNAGLPGKKYDLKLFVYGSAQYIFKTLGSKNFPDYVTRRKNEEQGIITNSIGTSLLCEAKKFSISIGVEYSSWGEKNVYAPYLIKKSAVENGSNQLYYRDVTDTLYINGNQVPHLYQVADSMFVSHIDTVTKSMYDQQVSSVNGVNKFYFIEVPVEFSYRLFRGKISMGATVGISPAWLVSEKGSYLNRDLSGVEYLSEIKSANKFMMHGRFGLDFYYGLNQRINIVVRPQINTSLSSIFRSDYDVNQRYYSAGLLFGLSYSIK